MRTIALIALFIFFPRLLPSADVAAGADGVRVAERAEFYEVEGDSAPKLRAQMAERGPVEKDGKHFLGRTNWQINWQYRWENRQGRAVLSLLTVTVDVTFKLPHRQPSGRPGDRLDAEWDRFSKALMTHERGHADNAVRRANQFHATLRAHGPFANKEALEEFVAVQGRQCIADANAGDVEHDRRTAHGVTQGATLNEPR